MVGVHRRGRGARGYCRHLEQCCIKVRLLAAQLHHNWRTTRPQSATRCASTCETVPQVCAEPAVTIAHQSVKSTCPSRKVCASHFVKPERRRTSPARSPSSSASAPAAARTAALPPGERLESATARRTRAPLRHGVARIADRWSQVCYVASFVHRPSWRGRLGEGRRAAGRDAAAARARAA